MRGAAMTHLRKEGRDCSNAERAASASAQDERIRNTNNIYLVSYWQGEFCGRPRKPLAMYRIRITRVVKPSDDATRRVRPNRHIEGGLATCVTVMRD